MGDTQVFLAKHFNGPTSSELHGLDLALKTKWKKPASKAAAADEYWPNQWSVIAAGADRFERPVVVAAEEYHDLVVLNGESGAEITRIACPGAIRRIHVTSGPRAALRAWIACGSVDDDLAGRGCLLRLKVLAKNDQSFAVSKRYLRRDFVGDVAVTRGVAVVTAGDSFQSTMNTFGCDAESGEDLWKHDQPTRRLTCDDESVYGTRAQSLVALHPHTGDTLWTRPWNSSHCFLNTVDGRLLAMNWEGILTSIDPATGATVWTAAIAPGMRHTQPTTVRMDGGARVVIRSTRQFPAVGRLTVLAVDSGTVVASIPFDQKTYAPTSITEAASAAGMLFVGTDRVGAYAACEAVDMAGTIVSTTPAADQFPQLMCAARWGNGGDQTGYGWLT